MSFISIGGELSSDINDSLNLAGHTNHASLQFDPSGFFQFDPGGLANLTKALPTEETNGHLTTIVYLSLSYMFY